jgi:hypothetical protein
MKTESNSTSLRDQWCMKKQITSMACGSTTHLMKQQIICTGLWQIWEQLYIALHHDSSARLCDRNFHIWPRLRTGIRQPISEWGTRHSSWLVYKNPLKFNEEWLLSYHHPLSVFFPSCISFVPLSPSILSTYHSCPCLFFLPYLFHTFISVPPKHTVIEKQWKYAVIGGIIWTFTERFDII